MINRIFYIFILFTLFIQEIKSQTDFYNLSFEKTDSSKSSVFQWQYEYLSSGTKFIIDKEISCSFNNSLYIYNIRPKESASVYLKLPEKYYKNLRSITISVNIRQLPSEGKTGGLWFKVLKDKRNINLNKYKKYYCSATSSANLPYSWTNYGYEITKEEDPDIVMIGLSVSKKRAWFDDISIKVNGEPITDLVFSIPQEN